MHDRRFPASQAERLDNPERLLWLPPGDVLAALGVQIGATVADVGAGTGYFALPLSSAVGAAGKVYAVDGQSEMLAWIKGKLDQAEFAPCFPMLPVSIPRSSRSVRPVAASRDGAFFGHSLVGSEHSCRGTIIRCV